jgi:phosphoribosylformylglycinamidine (FGAM) synthase-like amidotransferase family enzyme
LACSFESSIPSPGRTIFGVCNGSAICNGKELVAEQTDGLLARKQEKKEEAIVPHFLSKACFQ